MAEDEPAAGIEVNHSLIMNAVSSPSASLAVGASSSSSKSEARIFKFIDASKPAATLAWESLRFSVQAKGGRQDILKGMTGDLRPAELTCILGPSGSGKTSLLNILAGRVRKGGVYKADLSGEVRVNGRAIDPSRNQQLFGYVMQDDALLGTMTPREVLQFAADLRLDGASGESKALLIADLLESMGLTNCADTMVGNELIKGISGGERKRAAVGAELITNPQITFLDEPTSGLDSGAAYDVVALLKQLARMNRSVLCTIHQPSSEIFTLFDQAIFLVGGEVAYHGPPSGIRSHFDALQLECPEDYNPADFVMFCIQADDEQQIRAIVQGWSDAGAARPAPAAAPTAEAPAAPRRKGFRKELVALSSREVRRVLRDKGTLGVRFGATIFLALLYGFVFFQIGAPGPQDSPLAQRDVYDMQSHAGALMMLGMGGMFGAAQPLLLTFASERPVFIREYASNMYSTLPYFLSKTVIEVPLVGSQALVQWLIAYWLMAMQGNFGIAFIGSLMISLAATSTALLAACLVKNAKQAMEVAPGLFVPQILFAGFFIKMEFVPVFMRWLQYVCSLKWGMNILFWNEFQGTAGGDRFLEANDIRADEVWLFFVVLLAISVAFRVLAAFALSRKARAFYN